MPGVTGRLLKVPSIQVCVTESGIMLVVDDQANPEFWARITFTADEWFEALRLYYYQYPEKGLAAFHAVKLREGGRTDLFNLVDPPPADQVVRPDQVDPPG